MSLDEVVGSTILGHEDPEAAARRLVTLLLDERRTDDTVQRAGFDPLVVHALASRLPADPVGIALACALGLSWARGHRSATKADTWELVASWDEEACPLPRGVRRTTGEVLSSLVASARRSVHLVAPFADRSGLECLVEAFRIATRRGTSLKLVLGGEHTRTLASWLRSRVRHSGDPSRLRVSVPRPGFPWPHLKVAVADASMAYLGSANLTEAALTGRNIELGVLLSGPGVRVVADLISELVARAAPV